MLWIWTSAIFFWEGRGNMMLMLPTREEITYMCLLERERELPWGQSTTSRVYEEEGVLSYIPMLSAWYELENEFFWRGRDWYRISRQRQQAHGSRNNSFGRHPSWPKYPAKTMIDHPVDRANAERWDLTFGSIFTLIMGLYSRLTARSTNTCVSAVSEPV